MALTEMLYLPGLDGTTRLCQRFVAAAPPHLRLTPIPLPMEASTYSELADRIAQRVPNVRLPVLIAESFSGPLAVLVAKRRPVAALIFCNSFVVPPRNSALRWLALPAALNLRVPEFILRRYLVGEITDQSLLREVAETIASVPAPVLAGRLRLVLTVDEAATFADSTAPALYVRGTEDRLVTDASWRRMAALRQLTVAEVSGPHFLLQVNPLGAWKAISGFIKSLPLYPS